MYFTVKAALRSLLLPPASSLLIILIGWLLIRRYKRTGVSLVVIGILSIWLLSTGVVSGWLWQVAESAPAFNVAVPTDAQAIVIIGGGGIRTWAPEYQGPAPEPLLLDRIGYGAFLSRATGLPLLISGAPEEVIVMRAALERNFGLKPTWVEGESRDTYQNARLSSNILKPAGVTRIILVTMATHMRRAAGEFREAGFTVTPAPTGVKGVRRLTIAALIPSSASLDHSSAAIYELLGEPARRIQAALGIRELLDKKSAPK